MSGFTNKHRMNKAVIRQGTKGNLNFTNIHIVISALIKPTNEMMSNDEVYQNRAHSKCFSSEHEQRLTRKRTDSYTSFEERDENVCFCSLNINLEIKSIFKQSSSKSKRSKETYDRRIDSD